MPAGCRLQQSRRLFLSKANYKFEALSFVHQLLGDLQKCGELFSQLPALFLCFATGNQAPDGG
jgi:hypothetical protein